MPVGPKQHIVPQQMIRRFAADDGTLAELHKPSLKLGTRRRRPKGILYQEDFYKDRHSNFDEEILRPIEDSFARYYPSIADCDPPVPPDGKGGAALIDWIASMLCRTPFLDCAGAAIAMKKGPLGQVLWDWGPRLMTNVLRIQQYSEYQDLLSRPRFRWKMKVFPQGVHVVLTDNPVCCVPSLGRSERVVVVPLSKSRVLIGGDLEAIETWRTADVDQINAILAAWAGRSVFAADKATLNRVVWCLEDDDSPFPAGWREAACQPFYGLLDRIVTTMPPSEGEVSRWWDSLKGRFGETILPWKKQRASKRGTSKREQGETGTGM